MGFFSSCLFFNSIRKGNKHKGRWEKEMWALNKLVWHKEEDKDISKRENVTSKLHLQLM